MQLKAGNISLTYQSGALRWLKYGDCEILRMIYFTVRDKNWGTVEPVISNEIINQQEKCFAISYDCNFNEGDIQMNWKVIIEGKENSSIHFEIKAKAVSTFQKNRVGFCVLHPIKECAGKSVTIFHSDKTIEAAFFPEIISPHQPFKDIKAMKWKLTTHCNVLLEFAGDVFETEDHRNWTDNNFKTYCTPLSLPFPVMMNKGEEVHQTIQISLEGGATILEESDDEIKITISENEGLPVPCIGVGRAFERSENHFEELKSLSGIGFSHYRVDIKMNEADWKSQLYEAIAENKILNAKLEIALFADKNTAVQVQLFADAFSDDPSIKYITVLPLHTKYIDNKTLKTILPLLRNKFIHAGIGAGTDAYFTELNRSELDAHDLDFVSYSVNPQVHAFDDASLIENTEAQGFTILSAKNKFNKPVHISPITLKMRYNADATEKNKSFVPLSDPRQQTMFGAGWTLSSLKYVSENGASAVTYFETIGERGLGNYNENKKFQWYPLAEIFKIVLQNKWTNILKSNSTKAFTVNSLVLCNNEETCMLIANHTALVQNVTVECQNQLYAIKSLLSPNESISIFAEHHQLDITLNAYEIKIITWKRMNTASVNNTKSYL